MPRSANPPYNFSVPAGTAAVSGQVISSVAYNNFLSDLTNNALNAAWPISYGGTGTTDGSVLAPDGSFTVPAFRFQNETSTGIYRVSAGDIGISVLGAKIVDVIASGLTVAGAVTATTVNGQSVIASPTTSNDPFSNLAIGTPTVLAGALTIPFTGTNGSAIAAANIAYVNFRSATAGSGAVSQLALNSAQSLIVPSGASLGSVNAIATTYVLAAFKNASAVVYGIINPTTLPITDGIASTTLLDGSATSAGVWYTTTALTSKAYTIIGYFTATEATAGTWATAPSTVQIGPAPATANAFSRISLGTAVATTSGTSIDFTGIAAAIAGGARRVTISFAGLSTSGTDDCIIQIGDSGGIETSGYLGAATLLPNSSSPLTTNYTTGFGLTNNLLATNVAHGTVTLTLIDPATATWAYTSVMARSDGAASFVGAGSKSLSPGPLDRVRLTTTGGTDTFDAGKANISYE